MKKPPRHNATLVKQLSQQRDVLLAQVKGLRDERDAALISAKQCLLGSAEIDGDNDKLTTQVAELRNALSSMAECYKARIYGSFAIGLLKKSLSDEIKILKQAEAVLDAKGDTANG